ncbi:DUF2752 domain-containing protein [Mumia sp. ZJ1417]|uniref:DUF2752 domain-containing protein n=1 Tax=Mumia sp. ZJ1417 TaxID=2708082 RepID=UPI001420D910|nr:DUF2752 domain-containing protein [Mumia sp. ZJ1417]QMW67796.1 DUF2752 domain-containing protein [Mumia sp. ZJ1417]
MTTTATAARPVSRWRALRTPLLVGGGGLAAAALLHFRDPNVSGSYGYCPFALLTGLDCPGCGGLRAAHALTDLDIATAASSNILAVALAVALVMAWVVWLPRRLRDPRARMIVLTSRVGVAVLGVALAFTLLRNTPWGAWFAS